MSAYRRKFPENNLELSLQPKFTRRLGTPPHPTPRLYISVRTVKTPSQFSSRDSNNMVLQDLGRRINAAVSDLTRSSNLDEKVSINYHKLSSQRAILTHCRHLRA